MNCDSKPVHNNNLTKHLYNVEAAQKEDLIQLAVMVFTILEEITKPDCECNVESLFNVKESLRDFVKKLTKKNNW